MKSYVTLTASEDLEPYALWHPAYNKNNSLRCEIVDFRMAALSQQGMSALILAGLT
jgi:hypothetical protein